MLLHGRSARNSHFAARNRHFSSPLRASVAKKGDVKYLCCVTRAPAHPQLGRKGTGTWLNRVVRRVEARAAVLDRCKTTSVSRMNLLARIRMLCCVPADEEH